MTTETQQNKTPMTEAAMVRNLFQDMSRGSPTPAVAKIAHKAFANLKARGLKIEDLGIPVARLKKLGLAEKRAEPGFRTKTWVFGPVRGFLRAMGGTKKKRTTSAAKTTRRPRNVAR